VFNVSSVSHEYSFAEARILMSIVVLIHEEIFAPIVSFLSIKSDKDWDWARDFLLFGVDNMSNLHIALLNSLQVMSSYPSTSLLQ
jgi:hypothetical protein